jgi:hypothetical protein
MQLSRTGQQQYQPPLSNQFCSASAASFTSVEPTTYSLRGSYIHRTHSAGSHVPRQPRQLSRVSMTISISCMRKIRPHELRSSPQRVPVQKRMSGCPHLAIGTRLSDCSGRGAWAATSQSRPVTADRRLPCPPFGLPKPSRTPHRARTVRSLTAGVRVQERAGSARATPRGGRDGSA